MPARDPVTIISGYNQGEDAPPPEDDIEAAFQEWKQQTENTETKGHVRVFRIPLDDKGQPSYSSKNQARLGSWPIDLYTFDELCSLLVKDYMLPGEKMMAVRCMGTIDGKPGLAFNKIWILQRPNSADTQPTPASGANDPMSAAIRAMMETQESTMRTMQAMLQGRDSGSGGGGANSVQQMMQLAVLMKTLNEPMVTMMTAIMGRGPLPAAGGAAPGSDLKSLLEGLALLDDLRGGRGGGGSETADIIRAVSGIAGPTLQMIAASRANNPVPARRIAQPRAPVTVAQPAQPAPNPAPNPAPTPLADFPGSTPTNPAPQGQPAVTDPNTPTDPQANNMFAQVKPQIDSLVQMAAQGADPLETANLFFDEVMLPLEDKEYGKICDLVMDTGFLGKISVFNPAVKQYAHFFTAMRDRIVARINEEDAASKAG